MPLNTPPASGRFDGVAVQCAAADAAGPPARRRGRAWLAAALAAVALIQLPFVLWTGGFGWDDGAITIAFAHTLATTGRFSLTPPSEIVEGSSSLAFSGLLALPFALGDIGFDSALLWSRLLSAVFVVALAAAVWTYLKPWVGGTLKLALFVTLLASLPFFSREIINGMEMTAYAAGMVCFLILYERKSMVIAPVIVLLLLFRVEAVFHLSVALVLLYAIERDNRPFILRCLIVLLAGFAVITLCRYLYFGDILPNTVRAKMNPPYTPHGLPEMLQLRIGAIFEIARVLGIPLAAAGWLFAHRFRHLSAARRTRLLRLTALTVGILSFSVLIGQNWGYEGRMILAAVPLVFIALIGLAMGVPKDEAPAAKRPWLGIAATCVVAVFIANAGLAGENAWLMAHAAGLTRPPAQPGWYGITPYNYRITGKAVVELGKMLGLRSVVFMVPDVGGTALCCRSLRIVDLAGLTNRRLAHAGYGSIPEIIAEERPDIIQAHKVWAVVSRLYDLPAFIEQYRPVIFRNTLLWLRRDHVRALKAQGLLTRWTDVRALAQQDTRYAFPADRARLADLGLPIGVIEPPAARR